MTALTSIHLPPIVGSWINSVGFHLPIVQTGHSSLSVTSHPRQTTMAEHYIHCADCNVRASGRWKVDFINPMTGVEKSKLLHLCARCGLAAYVKRHAFIGAVKSELLVSYNTDFVQAQDVPREGDKHWVESEHTPQPRVMKNGMTAVEMLNKMAREEGKCTSHIHPSLLEGFK